MTPTSTTSSSDPQVCSPSTPRTTRQAGSGLSQCRVRQQVRSLSANSRPTKPAARATVVSEDAVGGASHAGAGLRPRAQCHHRQGGPLDVLVVGRQLVKRLVRRPGSVLRPDRVDEIWRSSTARVWSGGQAST